MVQWADVRVLRVFCPMATETLAALVVGDASALERDALAAPVLAAVRACPALGDFGLYRAVMEVGPGVELFTPDAAARPTLGHADTPTASPTAVLTVHIGGDVPEAVIDAAIEAILAAHPWETPVIDLNVARLARRG